MYLSTQRHVKKRIITILFILLMVSGQAIALDTAGNAGAVQSAIYSFI